MQIEPKDFELYESCILDGQVPHDEAAALQRDNPEFAEWYGKREKDRRLFHLKRIDPANFA